MAAAEDVGTDSSRPRPIAPAMKRALYSRMVPLRALQPTMRRQARQGRLQERTHDIGGSRYEHALRNAAASRPASVPEPVLPGSDLRHHRFLVFAEDVRIQLHPRDQMPLRG